MMRTIIASLFALVCFSMASCTDDNVLIDEITQTSSRIGADTRSNAGEAYVRFAMYSDIYGYNVRVKNLRVENCMNPKNIPSIGTAITDAEVLPTNAQEMVYDNADGRYNTVNLLGEQETWIVVHFDVEISSAGSFESKMTIEDVKYYIAPNEAWQSGNYYDHIIKVDASLLGLSEITFDATVEDFQNENNAEV